MFFIYTHQLAIFRIEGGESPRKKKKNIETIIFVALMKPLEKVLVQYLLSMQKFYTSLCVVSYGRACLRRQTQGEIPYWPRMIE